MAKRCVKLMHVCGRECDDDPASSVVTACMRTRGGTSCIVINVPQPNACGLLGPRAPARRPVEPPAAPCKFFRAPGDKREAQVGCMLRERNPRDRGCARQALLYRTRGM